MDPSIVKLLEEDVDESMHSGVDVDAFTATLNRDIGVDMDTVIVPGLSDSSTVTKCNMKGICNDLERFLSMCVEERLKGLIGNLVRFSKQRVDIEKTAHTE